MTKSAKVEDGAVTQVALGNPGGWIDCGDAVQIGWSYDGENFTAPPPVEPEIPSRAELKIQLDAALEAKMNSLADSQPGAWKALVLKQRVEEAEAAAQDGDPQSADYPALAALLGSSYGESIADVAAAILSEQAVMTAALTAIDRTVVLGKEAVDAAEGDEAALSAYEAAAAALA